MTNKVWMVGMMLIAFVIGMLSSQDTSAQQGSVGRHRIVPVADNSFFVWRIDTVTGEVSRCQGGGRVDSGCFLIGRASSVPQR